MIPQTLWLGVKGSVVLRFLDRGVLLLGDGLASYQVVGEVMAHQAYDG